MWLKNVPPILIYLALPLIAIACQPSDALKSRDGTPVANLMRSAKLPSTLAMVITPDEQSASTVNLSMISNSPFGAIWKKENSDNVRYISFVEELKKQGLVIKSEFASANAFQMEVIIGSPDEDYQYPIARSAWPSILHDLEAFSLIAKSVGPQDLRFLTQTVKFPAVRISSLRDDSNVSDLSALGLFLICSAGPLADNPVPNFLSDPKYDLCAGASLQNLPDLKVESGLTSWNKLSDVQRKDLRYRTYTFLSEGICVLPYSAKAHPETEGVLYTDMYKAHYVDKYDLSALIGRFGAEDVATGECYNSMYREVLVGFADRLEARLARIPKEGFEAVAKSWNPEFKNFAKVLLTTGKRKKYSTDQMATLVNAVINQAISGSAIKFKGHTFDQDSDVEKDISLFIYGPKQSSSRAVESVLSRNSNESASDFTLSILPILECKSQRQASTPQRELKVFSGVKYVQASGLIPGVDVSMFLQSESSNYLRDDAWSTLTDRQRFFEENAFASLKGQGESCVAADDRVLYSDTIKRIAQAFTHRCPSISNLSRGCVERSLSSSSNYDVSVTYQKSETSRFPNYSELSAAR